MKIVGEESYIPAAVPGSVYNDLLTAGRMDDPFYRDNEDRALKLMENDFEYRGTFDVIPGEVEDADEVLLRFNGLDTIADIELNGRSLGSVNNMHRTWDYSVKDYLKEKGNELTIHFHSPVKYIKEQYEQDPAILGTEDAMRGFPKIRKAHYMFGWDWGARLPDAGIWKEVELLKVKGARLTRVYNQQFFDNDLSNVTLKTIVSVTLPGNPDSKYIVRTDGSGYSFDTGMLQDAGPQNLTAGMTVTLKLTDPDGYTLAETTEKSDDHFKNFSESQYTFDGLFTFSTPVASPKLWWPNGLGSQPLYRLTVILRDADGNELDSVTQRIGMRKLSVSTVKDEFGSEFAYTVNNVKFFAMGANYIPEDNIICRMNKDRTRNLLQQCVAAHFNCIRVWGGGIYASDDFYDACDEMGLVVWQDFMFACANYRLTPEFAENITNELKDQIRRLAHHASLGLWSGNNEMEMFAGKGEWGATDEIRKDYLEMYENLFPKIMRLEGPDHFYWPASPSSGGGFDEPNSPDRGDAHYWDVWHGDKPFTEYRKFFFRFLSEFGFQSFPSIKTIESFTLPEDRNVFSYIMEKHQRNASANGKIMNYLGQTFLYPNDFDTLIYASQLLQAEAIRYGVEHLRRNRGRCMGTVYWQLNDCWPVASWSSIDYFGRWKALHYYAQRFFAPVMISCEEEGLLTQSQNVNAEPFEVNKGIRLSVTNETMEAHTGTVRWQLRHADGSVIHSEEESVSIDALSSKWLDAVSLQDAELYSNYVSYQYLENDSIISEGTVLFCPPKHFKFLDPELSVKVEGEEIVVSAKHFAKSIEIRNENDDLILSDNYFDLNNGEKRVKVLKGTADKLRIRSVYDIR
ncbi:MAG: glycoside hydrolase family 2 protein [Eubacterium sp.]|nr:glycoside hydrolase family 2 protein [Eubacterium sp.]